MILEQYWWPEQGTGRGTQCFDIPEIADLTQFRMGVDSKICSVTNDEILVRGKVITFYSFNCKKMMLWLRQILIVTTLSKNYFQLSYKDPRSG